MSEYDRKQRILAQMRSEMTSAQVTSVYSLIEGRAFSWFMWSDDDEAWPFAILTVGPHDWKIDSLGCWTSITASTRKDLLYD